MFSILIRLFIKDSVSDNLSGEVNLDGNKSILDNDDGEDYISLLSLNFLLY